MMDPGFCFATRDDDEETMPGIKKILERFEACLHQSSCANDHPPAPLQSTPIILSYAVWCILVDLLHFKKGCLEKEHFKTFQTLDFTKNLYAALTDTNIPTLTIDINVDEFNMNKSYITDRIKERLEQQLSRCFNKQICFHFCLYRF